MKILVNATALNARGGFSVAKSFLEDIYAGDFLASHGCSIRVLVSNPKLVAYRSEYSDVEVKALPKRSLMHKWWFERHFLPKLIETEEFDAYLSLQNLGLGRLQVPQFVLVHQPIPFADLERHEIEWKNYVKYKVMLDWMYRRYAQYWDGVFVQTNWMKEAFIGKFGCEGRVHVIRPAVSDITRHRERLPEEVSRHLRFDGRILLYPTSVDRYKNFARLAEATEVYNRTADCKVRLLLTIPGESTEHVKYVGKVPYECMYSLYSQAHGLIFPSLVETLGLPLLEALQVGVPVLAADLPYAHEVCGAAGDYFDPRSTSSMCEAIERFVTRKSPRGNHGNLGGENYRSYLQHILATLARRIS